MICRVAAHHKISPSAVRLGGPEPPWLTVTAACHHPPAPLLLTGAASHFTRCSSSPSRYCHLCRNLQVLTARPAPALLNQNINTDFIFIFYL